MQVLSIKSAFGDISRKPVSIWRQTAAVSALLISIYAIAGCALSPSGDISTPEARADAVRTKVNARWSALIKGDYDAAYAYLSSASRTDTPLDVYRHKMKLVQYRDARVNDVVCETDVCKVSVTITYDYQKFKGVQTPQEERWVVENGQLWYVYRG